MLFDLGPCGLRAAGASPSLPYFVTDTPSHAAPAPDRTVVPIRDAMAHATFHLLARADGRPEAADVFEWVRAR